VMRDVRRHAPCAIPCAMSWEMIVSDLTMMYLSCTEGLITVMMCNVMRCDDDERCDNNVSCTEGDDTMWCDA
jgi:hypothetical protein